MNGETPPAPAAFRLDDPDLEIDETTALELEELDTAGAPPAVAAPQKRRPFARIGSWFLAAFSALVSFMLGVAVTDFIFRMFERADWLGWTALGLAALTAALLLALILREAFALARLARVTHLRADGETAAVEDDRDAARAVLRKVTALYAKRPETARGRAAVKTHAAEIIDGRDLLRLAERELMTPLDAQARAMISASAQRVSVVTAVSPRALIDVLFVLFEAMRLIRRIGALYGGRPSGLALLKLARMALANLAVTGGVALTDSLVHQIVGHGLAARLSARLGEGVVNGLMAARIGLAAQNVCRPLPWLANQPPRMKDVVSTLAGSGGKAPKG